MWFAGKDCCKTGTKNKVVVHNTTTARQWTEKRRKRKGGRKTVPAARYHNRHFTKIQK
jgi:hypothetical protein